jgi:hypothetical protein
MRTLVALIMILSFLSGCRASTLSRVEYKWGPPAKIEEGNDSITYYYYYQKKGKVAVIEFTATPDGKITNKKKYRAQGMPSEVKPPSAEPAPSVPIPSTSGTNIVVVTATSANIRQGAGNEFAVAATVKQGDELILLGESGDWFNVQLENGQEGWISNKFAK